ncbi:zinc finger protein 2 homolog isoform X1 [Alosa sapidissima]|uniref:zinc finger protein 2 homolog isoform X1 n=2 Tax=Alosa sapidissima TaxID=34773 RepID=UPI001C0909BD|nr:zinc finger protein 2 homolog isoform X1 [Alosa sapidissima]
MTSPQMRMNGLKDIYQDIPPVTLRLAEDRVTSHLYCSSTEGMEARVSSLVEAFLVEVYRCRVCKFTSSIKASISTHVAETHDLSSLTCLEKDNSESADVGLEVEESEVLNQNDTPYDLDGELHSKDGEDHMDHIGLERMSFLLPMYGMLQNISPQSCEMGLSSNSESSLHVEETCEVSTLFAENGNGEDSEEESVFQLRDSRTDLPNALSCRLDSDVDDEEMAQSAHLMTLGLCRISSNRVHQQSSIPDSKPASGTQDPGDFIEDKQTSLSVPETLQQIEEDGSMSCILCHVVVSNRSLLDVHLKCHNGPQEFRCPRCGVEAQEWTDMECHWRGHSKRRGARPHRCTVCHKTFQCKDARRAHEQKHKRRKQAQTQPRTVLLQCPSCDEWCQSTSEFELHKRSHCQGGFKCPQCDFLENSWKKVHRHIRTKHKYLEKRKKKCQELHNHLNENSQKPKMFEPDTWYQPVKKRTKQITTEKEREGQSNGHPQEQTLRLKKNTGGRKEFCCTLCDRKFSTKMTMRRHMGIHQGDKPFECPHCDYCTRLKASLEQHLRVHTGEKPFKCTQCSYASIDRSSLRRHLRTHTQEKPYCCQYCSYSSIQKKSLDLHLRRHHTGESFPCHLCKYTTPDRQLLVRHVRKHHSSENSPLLSQKTASACPVPSRNTTKPAD